MGDPAAHAKLSASGAVRWMACPASVRMEELYPRSSSKYAEEGTAAHSLAETCLRAYKDADYYIGQEFEQHIVDLEMAEYAQEYVNYVRALDGFLDIERRVDFSKWVPGGFGTADAILLKDGTIDVVDLKYGKGVQVDSANNPQGMLYGLGAYHEFSHIYEIEQLRLTIVQPRMDHISEWEISTEDLLAFGEEASKAAELALTDDPPFNPGPKQCLFCGAKAVCPARAEQNLELAVEGFETVTNHGPLKKVTGLTNDEIAHILHNVDSLKSWANSIEAHAQDLLERGETVEGFKLVRGRSIRKWRDEAAAAKSLVNKLNKKGAYTEKLISPTQAEKLLGKNSAILQKHCYKPEGKPTIAVESDKRPAILDDATDGFEVSEELENEAA